MLGVSKYWLFLLKKQILSVKEGFQLNTEKELMKLFS